MNQRPIAISMLLCELTIIDQKTHNITPVNCFNSRRLASFPGHINFVALTWLTDGLGQMPAKLVVEQLENMEEVFRLERVFEFTNPLEEARCLVTVRDCPIPMPREYEVSLFVDGESIAHRKLSSERKESNMADDASSQNDYGTSETIKCVDIFIDGPGDTTVRPIPPERLERVKRERDKYYNADGTMKEIIYTSVEFDGPSDATVRPIPPTP